jgi:hypothetical protein
VARVRKVKDSTTGYLPVPKKIMDQLVADGRAYEVTITPYPRPPATPEGDPK